jgi:hypothetical protein
MAKPSLDYNSVEELPDNFWNKVNKTDTCWLWTGKMDDGYGRFNIRGKLYLAHRLTMAVLKAPIADNMQVDHLCGVRNCCNPDHLEQVTFSENTKRRRAISALPDITKCINGHPLIGDEARIHVSDRRTRSNGVVPSVTCKVCNSTRRLSDLEEAKKELV